MVKDCCVITDWYALYRGDCLEVMKGLPDESVHLSLYSPPFAGLYNYSSSPRDFSNSRSYAEFLDHLRFLVEDMHRITVPGRMSAVHCMDIPTGNTGCDALRDFPGDIIRIHEGLGFAYLARYCVWKEPLGVYLRTLQKSLQHRTVTVDSTRCSNASADYLLVFRRSGTNPVPVEHPCGLTDYAGSREPPPEVLKYRGWTGKQTLNRYSQWVWRQYASAFWDDVRIERVLPFRESKEDKDERHVHPLQLDVIERAVVLWSNPGETVFTPFMGVGSEVYGAVANGRRGVGVELKPTYYRQALRNLKSVDSSTDEEAQQLGLFAEAL